MAIQFDQPITAGTVLIRSDIRSQNFVAGSAGWRVEANGNAEFNSVIIRGGTVVSGLALYYNGAPAAGNLVMSISATAGVDSFGNAYVAGVGVYGTADKVTVKSSGGDTAVLRADAPSYVANSTGPGLELRTATEAGDGASITEYDDTFDHGMLLLSPSPVTSGNGGEDFSYIQMVGRFSADPSIQLIANGPDSFVGINDTLFDAGGEMIAYNGGNWHTYTPVMANAGAATWSTRAGVWRRYGDWIVFIAYFVFSGAGTGATPVTVTGPRPIDRTTRQFVSAHLEAVAGGSAGFGGVVSFVSCSGAFFDRVRNPANTSMNGVDFPATSIVTVQGAYREQV